jgi:hypothetical protein
MNVGDGEPEIEGGHGKWFVRLKGALPVWAAIILFVVLAGGAALVRAYDKSALEHSMIAKRIEGLGGRIDMQVCVGSLQQNAAALEAMRQEMVRVAQVNGDVYQAIRLRWCPWMPSTEPGKREP